MEIADVHYRLFKGARSVHQWCKSAHSSPLTMRDILLLTCVILKSAALRRATLLAQLTSRRRTPTRHP